MNLRYIGTATPTIGSAAMDREELIRNMRMRAEQCRRLASAMSSPIARKALIEMAEEAEADIRKLERSAED